MAHHLSPDEKQILKLLEKAEVGEDVRKGWMDAIQNNGLTQETIEEIHTALTTVPEGEVETAEMVRGRLLVEFSTLVKRWRFADQSRHFARR